MNNMNFSGYSNDRRVRRLAKSLFNFGQVFMVLWVVMIPASDINSPRTAWPFLLIAGVIAMSIGQLLRSNPLSETVYRLWGGVVLIVFFGVLLFNYDGAASHNGVMVTIIVCITAIVIIDGRKPGRLRSERTKSYR